MFGRHIWLVLAAILGVWALWGYHDAQPGAVLSDARSAAEMIKLFFVGPLALVGWGGAAFFAFALFSLRTPVPVPVRKDR